MVGDRPAVTSFVPPGYTAVAIPWNRIYGSEHLQIDDHLDLLASYQLERKRKVRETETRDDQNVVASEYEEYVSRGTDRTRDESLGERGESWFVATDAIVVGPVGFPPPAAAMRAIGDVRTNQANTQQMSGPALLIAVDNRDLSNVAMVLNTEDVHLSVAFRGQYEDSIPEGLRQIAVAPLDLPAYTEFSEHNWKGLRRDVTSRLVREDDARFADALTVEQIEQFYGRVLKTAKRRFSFFTADDFLPPGVQPGVAAGIGADSVLVAVTSDQVQSLSRFVDNDVVALILTGHASVPDGAVIHSMHSVGLAAAVVVQRARIVRAATDVSDTIALEIPRSDVAALTAALFAHDATDDGDKHSHRLMALATHRTDVAPTAAGSPVPQAGIPDYLPLRSAPQVYEILGDTTRTHFFNTEVGVVP